MAYSFKAIQENIVFIKRQVFADIDIETPAFRKGIIPCIQFVTQGSKVYVIHDVIFKWRGPLTWLNQSIQVTPGNIFSQDYFHLLIFCSKVAKNNKAFFI